MIHIKHLQRRWLFGTLDFSGVIITAFLAMYLRTSITLPFFRGMIPFYSFSWSELCIPVVLLAICYVVIQYIWGKYDAWASSSALIWSKRLALPNIFLLALVFSYLYLSQKFNFPRSVVVTFVALNFACGLLWRLIYFRQMERDAAEVLLIGGMDQLLPLAREFNFPPFAGKVKVAGIFTNDKKILMHEEEKKQIQYPIYPIADFKTYTKNNAYSSIIIDPSEFNSTTILKDLLSTSTARTPIYVLPSAYEILLGRLNHVQVNDLPLLELKLRVFSPLYVMLKRLFDISFSLFFLLLFSIPSIIIALIVKSTSVGTIFYTQQRIGINGKVFRIYKFRTMVRDAEKYTGAVLASKNDSRITRFGSLLRKTRLDEIPQLLNILCGDMSFVGPRPERPGFVKKFEREIPGYKERKRIRPGITGLAQVSGGYETSAQIKLKYDLAYLVNQSLLLDLQILLRTVKTILTKAGQ